MMMENVLKAVRDFADKAHGTQLRKYSSDRYIVHPVRVMEICRRYVPELPALAAALLHDVLEDTATTAQDILDFLLPHMGSDESKETVALVVELSDVYVKEDYPQFNRKKRKAMEIDRMSKTSATAQTIKYADILDNTKEIVEHDRHFAPVFLRECRQLLQVMDKGNPELYRGTFEAVDLALASLNKPR